LSEEGEKSKKTKPHHRAKALHHVGIFYIFFHDFSKIIVGNKNF
jgi:hypothetical protein